MEAPSVILSRIVRVGPGPGNAAAPDFTLSVALAPGLSALAAGRGAQPNPESPDQYPYIIAAGSRCLLAHFSVAPFTGTLFANAPVDSNLVVARHFHTGADGGQARAAAERIEPRTGRFPILWNIGSVALATNDGGEYTIAELQADTGTDRATIVYLRSSGRTGWAGKHVTYPLAAHHDRDWIPNGAAYADGALWWFDLSWGIISYDYDASLPVLRPDSDVDLVFHPLPDARALAHATVHDTPDLEIKRCVTASRNKLRYVEIITEEGQAAASRVCMWSRSRSPDGDGWQWDARYAVSFEDIWDDDSYMATGLPRNVPVLVVVSPSDPNLVYFALEQNIFGVNVPEHRVVSHQADALVVMPWLPRPLCGRFVVAWDLPPAVAQAL
nr:unnamed protein product [Digitaria exilis]